MTALSDQILADNEGVLNAMLGHRFVTGITDGTLPADVFHRYLVYEGGFVETAISIFAFATARAPDLEAKRWLVDVQMALVREQMVYFNVSYAALGIDRAIPIPRAVMAFDRGMYAIAETGDFLKAATAMFAAEWMYWTWCSAAARTGIADRHMRRWVELHADDGFAAQARWLKNAIDRYGAPGDRAELSGLFGHVTRLEIGFHDAAFDPAPGEKHA